MSVTRRDFLKAGAAAALAASGPRALGQVKPVALHMGAFDQRLDPASPVRTRVWGFNGALPGPVLRYRKGERARITVANELPQETTVHWHGVRVPNAMDGVPHVTQQPIGPGARFEYALNFRDSGTFWYHPHQNSFEQVPRGLYGALIVEEEKPIEVDRDEVWVLSDMKLAPDGQQVEDFGRILEIANDGRVGNQILLNGTAAGSGRSMAVRSGERLRLRLINAACARGFRLAFAGHRPLVIAYDGQGTTPHPAPTAGGLALGPGMRADLVIDCMQRPGESFAVSDVERGTTVIARLAYSPERPLRELPSEARVALAPNALPEPDLGRAMRHEIVFQGGMRDAPVIGLIDGKPSTIQALMQEHALAWTMNRTAQHEHALMHRPFLRLKRGEHVLLRMVNETGYWHPMHLHGHFFRVVALGGKPTLRRDWRDTVMMAARGSLDIAFVADNPGVWMFHCHILDHAVGGMMGTIAVED